MMHHTSNTLRAIHASVQAGAAIADIYRSDFAVEYKTDASPLTLADRRAHEIIVKKLRTTNIPILSEEGQDIPYEQRKTWDRFWIVDPLDGTKEFIKRNGEFTVNIALVEKDRPVLGVVFLPDKETLYFAALGMGAYKIERKSMPALLESTVTQKDEDGVLQQLVSHALRLPAYRSSSSSLTIVGSRSHATPELQQYVEKKRQEYGEIAFIAAGSSLKFCVVAEGRADIYPRLGPTMEWDTAAGQTIAENAGGRVVRYDTGEPLTYNKKDLLNPWFIVSRKPPHSEKLESEL